MSDCASKALAKGFLPQERRVYDVISNREDVSLTTLNHRALGRRSTKSYSQSGWAAAVNVFFVLDHFIYMEALKAAVQVHFRC